MPGLQAVAHGEAAFSDRERSQPGCAPRSAGPRVHIIEADGAPRASGAALRTGPARRATASRVVERRQCEEGTHLFGGGGNKHHSATQPATALSATWWRRFWACSGVCVEQPGRRSHRLWAGSDVVTRRELRILEAAAGCRRKHDLRAAAGCVHALLLGALLPGRSAREGLQLDRWYLPPS